MWNIFFHEVLRWARLIYKIKNKYKFPRRNDNVKYEIILLDWHFIKDYMCLYVHEILLIYIFIAM